MADVFDRLDIHSGTVFNYHQSRRKTKQYLSDLELLQYDILYGEQHVYGGKKKNPVGEGHMQMGVLDVTLTELLAQMDGSYSLYGDNFTKQSKVYINGEKQKTTFLNNTRIEIPEAEIKEGDTVEVSQVGSSNRISEHQSSTFIREENWWKHRKYQMSRRRLQQKQKNSNNIQKKMMVR